MALPAADRPAFLEGACPTPEARARITSLLKTLEEGLTVTAPPVSGSELRGSDPRHIGAFEIIRRLGQGGMGVVYLGYDAKLDRKVAIKVLASHLTGSEQALGRFHDEAKTAAALKNPGIVTVFDFGFDGERHYIVSEFVAGSTLKELIAKESKRREQTQTTGGYRVQWRRRIAQLVSRVAEALEHSHRANVVHRDVKPSNILVGEDDQPHLTDFGIAKHLAPDLTLEFTQGLGSCHYMSPEQAAIEDSRVDARSDLFSLGVVLYEALTLRKPFDGKTPEEVLHAVRTLEPLPLRTLDPGIPRDLETICAKALEKSPERRYQSAMHMAADLRSFLEQRPIMARPPTLARRALRWTAARRTSFTAALLTLLVTALSLSAWANSKARASALGLLSVESSVPGLRVVVQPVDPRTREIAKDAALEADAPLREVRLKRGQYRVTVVSSDRQSFTEFNAVLLTPGQENHLTLVVEPPTASPPDNTVASAGETTTGTGSSSPVPAESARALPATQGRSMLGRLIPTSRVISDDMVQVPGGIYEFGWAQTDNPIIARRDARVETFFIDRTLVSNAQYKAFLEATGHPWPKAWQTLGYDPALADHPVVVVTCQDAEAYALWVGKRLPTAFEWQAAARGLERRRFPWGNQLDTVRGRAPKPEDVLGEQSWDAKVLYALYARNTSPTHADDGMEHPANLRYMFGPLREYTQTLEPSLEAGLIVGRCWTDAPSVTDMTRIYSYPVDMYSFKHGFRCAKSASAAGEPSPADSTSSAHPPTHGSST